MRDIGSQQLDALTLTQQKAAHVSGFFVLDEKPRSFQIKHVLPRMHARQAEQRISVRRGNFEQLPDFTHARDKRIELYSAATFRVLQHRGFESAELERDLVTIFGLLRYWDADVLANRLGLQHHGADEAAQQIIT